MYETVPNLPSSQIVGGNTENCDAEYETISDLPGLNVAHGDPALSLEHADEARIARSTARREWVAAVPNVAYGTITVADIHNIAHDTTSTIGDNRGRGTAQLTPIPTEDNVAYHATPIVHAEVGSEYENTFRGISPWPQGTRHTGPHMWT